MPQPFCGGGERHVTRGRRVSGTAAHPAYGVLDMECVGGTVELPAATNQVGVERFSERRQLTIAAGCREQIACRPARQQVNWYVGDGHAAEFGRLVIRGACSLPLAVLPQGTGQADQGAGAHAGRGGVCETAVERGSLRIIAVPKFKPLAGRERPRRCVIPSGRVRVVQQPLLGKGLHPVGGEDHCDRVFRRGERPKAAGIFELTFRHRKALLKAGNDQVRRLLPPLLDPLQPERALLLK